MCTRSPTWTFTHCVRHGQLEFVSSVNTRYPLMLKLGGSLPQLTAGPYLNSWIDWSNVSKVSCSMKQQHNQFGATGHQTWNLLITRSMLQPLAYSHTQLHTHTHTHACTHASIVPYTHMLMSDEVL